MDEKERIELARRRLYSWGEKTAPLRRRALRPTSSTVNKEWSHERQKVTRTPQKPRSFLATFFVVAALFFSASVLFSIFYFFGGQNIVSADKVNIEIQGPTSVGGGDSLELQISITNKNSTTLELADLLVEYPEGTRSPENLQREFLRFRESVGDIAPGGQVKKTVRAVLFGEENTQQKIVVTLEYRVPGSNAIFFADKSYDVTLSSAPVSISVRSFSEVVSGQDMDFSVVINSNSSTRVDNLTLKAEYPFGFEFKSAEPEARFSNSIWELGTLEPEEERTIHIVGTMTGQDSEERIFRFSMGVADELDPKKLATTFVVSLRTITIQKPFISTDLTLNDIREQEYVFEGGETISGEIAWENNLADAVSDVQIEARLLGDVVDEDTIFASQGFYNSVTDTLRWNKSTRSDFATIEPNQGGVIRFQFKTKSIPLLGVKNPEITLDVTVRGRRTASGESPEQIDSTISRVIRLNSDLVLTSRILRNSGPFVNTGPIPPTAEQESTYSVVWTITNVANQVSGTKVVTTLPDYVRWIGLTEPQNANLSFNQNARQITWNVGEVPQGVGLNLSPKEVSFQIGFIPSLSQVGEIPVLVHTQTITGFDQFTETQISRSSQSLSTRIQGEVLPSGHERVVK